MHHQPETPPVRDQSFPTDPTGLPEAAAPQIELDDGDTVNLHVAPVAKRLHDSTVRMLGYNGSIPGLTLHVQQGSEVIVEPTEPGYWPAANRDVVPTLDDVLLEDGKIAAFSVAETNYAAMGRYGNLLLIGGQTDLTVTARAGEVLRLWLTNTANSRVFNKYFSVGGIGGSLAGC